MWLESLETFRQELKQKWIRIHWNQFAKEWDKVIAIKDTLWTAWESIKWQVFGVMEIVVESQEWNWLWFSKKIKLSEQWDRLFNPQRFIKAN